MPEETSNKERMEFLEFITHICNRPAMFTRGSVRETLAYIDGYRAGNNTPISGRIFDRYVCLRNSFPGNYVWTYVIDACAKDDADAMRMIEETIVSFVRLKEKLSDDELIRHTIAHLDEENEAEKIFRQFDKALLFGDEATIRKLIEGHPDAGVLWKNSYPKDVAAQLLDISGGERVKSIPVSPDGNKLSIIAPGWPFPIEMNFTGGEWRINAGEIIALRMKQ